MLALRGTTIMLAALRSSPGNLVCLRSAPSLLVNRRKSHSQLLVTRAAVLRAVSFSPFSSDSSQDRRRNENDVGDIEDSEDYFGDFAVSAESSSTVARGTVYFVSTPLGNLDDITVRALKVLQAVDVIAAEDTRRTGRLLQLLGISTARSSAKTAGVAAGLGGSSEEVAGTGRGPILMSHHEHNTRSRVPQLVSRAQAGQSIAVVSDAGTPGIADPGLELARGCAAAGVPVVPVPGPCAAVAALSVAGFPCAEFVFFGFLPKRGSPLTKKVAEMCAEKRTFIFYEAPHRVASTVALLCAQPALANREVLFARELTKLHEELFRGSLQDASAWLAAKPGGKPKGEFTVVLSAPPAASIEEQALEAESSLVEAAREVAGLVAAETLSMSMAVKEVARSRGVSKKALYSLALRDDLPDEK